MFVGAPRHPYEVSMRFTMQKAPSENSRPGLRDSERAVAQGDGETAHLELCAPEGVERSPAKRGLRPTGT